MYTLLTTTYNELHIDNSKKIIKGEFTHHPITQNVYCATQYYHVAQSYYRRQAIPTEQRQNSTLRNFVLV